MGREIKISVLSAIAAIAAPAVAADQSSVERYYSPSYHACMEGAGGVDPEMRSCISAEHERWDGDLNGAYSKVTASLPSGRKTDLRTEERAWLRHTDRVCSHAGDDNAGGSLQMIEVNECYLNETIRRTLYLRSHR
jgi:uncharacterized protein YecT (DUF1311 family)